MKKAKIMLTAIAVLAVVGGSLAFKARSSHRFFIGTQANNCPALSTKVTTAENDATLGEFYIGTLQNECPNSTTVYSTAD
jgi:hypothetical protein